MKKKPIYSPTRPPKKQTSKSKPQKNSQFSLKKSEKPIIQVSSPKSQQSQYF